MNSHSISQKSACLMQSIFVTLFLAMCFALPSANAQSCTALFPSGTAAPGGYGASWNVFSTAKELLLSGTCSGDTVNVSIGSDQPNQYVFNQGFYWNGTQWRQLSLTGANPPTGTWLARQGKASFAKGTQDPAIFVGYVCQYTDNAWKCGCADNACTTPRWQVQALQTQTSGGGGGSVAGGPQCEGATAPAQAAAQGLTKLAFCEDFSDPSRIDFDNTPEQGKTSFVLMRPGNIFSASVQPKSAFTFTSEGTLVGKPTAANYQADFISTWPTGGGSYKGFAVSKNSTGWYAETRVKHNTWSGSKGFFAFWSMATCKLYGGANCSPFVEPDFYEYIGQKMIHATHWYPSSSTNANRKSTMCSISPNSDRTQFFTTGVLYGPDNSFIRWYDNEKVTCEKTKATYPQMSVMASQDFPIMFGSGPSQPYEIDWVRVWVKP